MNLKRILLIGLFMLALAFVPGFSAWAQTVTDPTAGGFTTVAGYATQGLAGWVVVVGAVIGIGWLMAFRKRR